MTDARIFRVCLDASCVAAGAASPKGAAAEVVRRVVGGPLMGFVTSAMAAEYVHALGATVNLATRAEEGDYARPMRSPPSLRF